MLYLLYRSLQNYYLYLVLIKHDNSLAILFHKSTQMTKLHNLMFLFLLIDYAQLLVVCQWISTFFNSFPDKLDQKGLQVPNYIISFSSENVFSYEKSSP